MSSILITLMFLGACLAMHFLLHQHGAGHHSHGHAGHHANEDEGGSKPETIPVEIHREPWN